jgi:hypothetical protein
MRISDFFPEPKEMCGAFVLSTTKAGKLLGVLLVNRRTFARISGSDWYRNLGRRHVTACGTWELILHKFQADGV